MALAGKLIATAQISEDCTGKAKRKTAMAWHNTAKKRTGEALVSDAWAWKCKARRGSGIAWDSGGQHGQSIEIRSEQCDGKV